MRLSDLERQSIKFAVRKHFGPGSRIFLFGSRLDDSKRGGDIDLFIETGLQGKELIKAKLQAMTDIQLRIGDQKIDIITASANSEDDSLIVQEARETGAAL